jgi:hypothetical protein
MVDNGFPKKKTPQAAKVCRKNLFLEARMGYVTKMLISYKVLIVFHYSDGNISKYTGK